MNPERESTPGAEDFKFPAESEEQSIESDSKPEKPKNKRLTKFIESLPDDIDSLKILRKELRNKPYTPFNVDKIAAIADRLTDEGGDEKIGEKEKWLMLDNLKDKNKFDKFIQDLPEDAYSLRILRQQLRTEKDVNSLLNIAKRHVVNQKLDELGSDSSV